MRAIRTKDFTYIRNMRPDRWPSGALEKVHGIRPLGDIDRSPVKNLYLENLSGLPLHSPDCIHRAGLSDLEQCIVRACGKRPEEELYDLRNDPHQLNNVVQDPNYLGIAGKLRKQLDAWMRATDDQRAFQDDDRWDEYPYYGRGFSKKTKSVSTDNQIGASTD